MTLSTQLLPPLPPLVPGMVQPGRPAGQVPQRTIGGGADPRLNVVQNLNEVDDYANLPRLPFVAGRPMAQNQRT